MDHRIAMAFLTLGLAAEKDVTIDDASMIATSFPGYRAIMESLGANFTVSDGRPQAQGHEAGAMELR
jgi:3-phosphoshikimate 1-carboxyvinyltransferase